MKLRPYQSELVQQVRLAWRQGFKSPCIVLPCGGGKSCIVADMARRTTDRGKRVLFLVHRRELVDQITQTFENWGVDMTLCAVCMVQTATRRLAKLERPALIITDENHHSLATSYKRIYEYFSDVPRVGVTATPVRLNGDGLGDVNDKLIVGVSAKWLIENGCLAPYDYYAPDVVDLTQVRTSRGEFVAADVEKAMSQKAKIFGDVIGYYRKLANGRKAICYCPSVKYSAAMAEKFCAAGIRAVHIDGEMPKTQRDDAIEKFRNGEIQILCNVDLISEGFDVPDCECAILLRPTKSLTLFIQQSMRCMRFRPGKRAIIIDHVGNYTRHGLPNDDRVWTLEKKSKETAKKQAVSGISLITCPECFYTFSGGNVCPACGHVIERRAVEADETVGLVKISGFKLNLKTPQDCHSYGELLAYAREHGYKTGWAYYKAKERGYIS